MFTETDDILLLHEVLCHTALELRLELGARLSPDPEQQTRSPSSEIYSTCACASCARQLFACATTINTKRAVRASGEPTSSLLHGSSVAGDHERSTVAHSRLSTRRYDSISRQGDVERPRNAAETTKKQGHKLRNDAVAVIAAAVRRA
jgi:hypothetical protein